MKTGLVRGLWAIKGAGLLLRAYCYGDDKIISLEKKFRKEENNNYTVHVTAEEKHFREFSKWRSLTAVWKAEMFLICLEEQIMRAEMTLPGLVLIPNINPMWSFLFYSFFLFFSVVQEDILGPKTTHVDAENRLKINKINGEMAIFINVL